MANKTRIIIYIFTLTSFLFSQRQNIRFEHLSIDDGLSNNIVYTILQDSRGFMWFGTEDGLNKYDGYNFTVYRHDPDDSLSISENWVWSLHESHYAGKHVLWVGTKNGGLNRMDLETEQFTHFRNIPDDPQSLSNDMIVSIYEDSFGELWVGTLGGINRFDRKTKKFVRYQNDANNPNSLSSNNYCTIYESVTAGKPVLWFGTWGGLNKFDRNTEEFTHYKHNAHNLNSLSSNHINDLYSDISGRLWIGTDKRGLNKFNIETEQFTRFQYEPNDAKSLSSNIVGLLGSILSDLFQQKKVLWIATLNGLNRLDLETEQFTHFKHDPGNPQSLCDNALKVLYKDKTGIIWIGTHGGGLSRFDPSEQTFTHHHHETGNLNSLSDNSIWSIVESKCYGPEVFWIGTSGGGLNKYDRNTGSFIHYHHDPDNANNLSSEIIFTLLESRFQGRNELWIGTLHGLDKFDLDTKKFTHYKYDTTNPDSISGSVIRSICEDKTGKLWIGTRNGGINRFDRNSGKFSRGKYYTGEALSIIENHTGTIWAGTSRGLFQYHASIDDFTLYTHDPDDPNSLSHNSVLSIFEDKSSRLWIGTVDGLNLHNRETNKFTWYKVEDGLPSNVINGILEDEHGNLWLSTNHGLSKFNPGQQSFRNYDKDDGLQSNQFMVGAACLSQKGEMLFGGIHGLNVFHPDSLTENPHIPEVHLTDFQIFNQAVEVKYPGLKRHDDKYYLPKHISNLSEITLSYKESVFSFQFAALDYHSPQKNRYAYQMEGVDPDWVYTDASRRYATYTQLAPGEYVFKVKGSNNDGLWNEKGTSIKIIITPPWWRTSLAYSIYTILIMGLILAIWRFQTSRLKMKQQIEMEHFEAEKLREVDHLKSRLFANISHEFRTPLTLIQGPIKQIISGEFTGNLKDQCKMILRNSDRLLNLINQLLDLSKLESGRMKLKASRIDLIQYLKGIIQSFASLAERNNISFTYNSAEESLMGYLDRDKLEKIVTNLLSNAFKFTPEGGLIDVRIFPTPLSIPPLSKGGKTGGVEISISNTGPGIPPDQLEKIFNRFYQAGTTYKKDSEGTGIGLALTKELVEACHGEIGVESEVNKNTTFTLFLPIGKEHFKPEEIVEEKDTGFRLPADASQAGIQDSVKEKAAQKDIPDSNASGIPHPLSSTEGRVPRTECQVPRAESRPASLRSPLLLIVEDNPDVTYYISSFLEQDYRIITAENGEEGWKKALQKFPDLVISDVMMPVMDGFELCKKLKGDERTSHIPVILLTAKADMESRIEGLEFDADDYISKPFDARELHVRVNNLIEQRKKLRERFSKLIEIKPGEVVSSSMDEQFLERLIEVSEKHLSESGYSTEHFAREVGISRSQLNRKLRALTELSTHGFILNLRLKRAAQLLKKKAGNITEIAYTVGFESPANFSRAFKNQFGKSPRDFAKEIKNQ